MGRTATSSAAKNIDDVKVVENDNEKTVVKNDDEKTSETKKTVKVEPLNDSDEIEVISLVPNVSYKDSKTYDMYEWKEVGHKELMTFETLKNMWRGNKGYFKNLWLKPNDDRVIKAFGLNRTFDRYEYLMDGSNYTTKKINTICDEIKATPNGLKSSICDKVKNLVINGEITDVSVIRTLENRLQIDLIGFLD